MDVKVEHHGSLYLLRPVSEAGQQWLDENIEPDAQRLGNAVAVEPRYVWPIVDGMRNDGIETGLRVVEDENEE